jgi:hypothetical protein
MYKAVADIATLPIRADVNLTSGEDTKVLNDKLATIAEQRGFTRLYWGLKVEDALALVMIIREFLSSPTRLIKYSHAFARLERH